MGKTFLFYSNSGKGKSTHTVHLSGRKNTIVRIETYNGHLYGGEDVFVIPSTKNDALTTKLEKLDNRHGCHMVYEFIHQLGGKKK